MYEAEVNYLTERIETLPLEIQQRFTEYREDVAMRTTLPWGEHCTECNWPTCYTSCSLYSPRGDKGCRLFLDGVVRVDQKAALNGYLLKIRFKRWGKLWTVGNMNLLSTPAAARKERVNILKGSISRSLPAPAGMKARILQKVSYLRRTEAEGHWGKPVAAEWFAMECYNPNTFEVHLTFSVRAQGSESSFPFQKRVTLPPGFTREKIRVAEIQPLVDLSKPFEVEIVPNQAENLTLYFGLLDFVKEKHSPSSEATKEGKQARTWKCIVWDLDNTLWDGVLVEDGPAKIRLRPEVMEIIKEADRRGILHSIASKNNKDEVEKVLKDLGISEYFLYPQVHWQPKSESIARIAKCLNIGLDAIAFVDDQPFERAEVQQVFNQVSLVDAAECAGLLKRAECQVPITEESRQRRAFYRQQQEREASVQSHHGEYLSFLKECAMQLTIVPLDESNLERVYELAQRTNQMNFSGNRYPKEELKELIGSETLDTFVMSCSDKFGSYGIIGFSVVDRSQFRLLDLMFSCRIQSKRVEHAFLAYLLKLYRSIRRADFYANYRPTLKNAPSGKVFQEVGFTKVAEEGGVVSLRFLGDREIPEDGIISITLKR